MTGTTNPPSIDATNNSWPLENQKEGPRKRGPSSGRNLNATRLD